MVKLLVRSSAEKILKKFVDEPIGQLAKKNVSTINQFIIWFQLLKCAQLAGFLCVWL